MNTPLDFMKNELKQLDNERYSENVKAAALKIAEKFDDEGHSGFSIGFFYNAMRRYMIQAYQLRLKEPMTWLKAMLELNVSFGAEDMEDTACKDHFKRTRVFDDFNITDPKEVDDVLSLVRVYAFMEPIREIDLTDDSLFETNPHSDTRHHRDAGMIIKRPNGEISHMEYACFSDDGGNVWFTGSDSHGVIPMDHPLPIRRLYVLRASEDSKELHDYKRTCRPGELVRNPHGDLFEIVGYATHPDTTQPYFRLKQKNQQTLMGSDDIIVSSSTLNNLMIEYPPIGLSLPAYAQWPVDTAEKEDGK